MDDIVDYISNPRTGLYDEDKIYRKLKAEGYAITHKKLKKIINDLYAYQITKQQLKPKEFNTVWAKDIGNNYQVDLMVYTRFQYNNYKYIFNCIDVHSRFAHSVAMTNNKNETLLKAFQKCFEVMGKPKAVFCDLEFDTKLLQDYANKNDIQFVFSEPNEKIKNVIVERFNGTLAKLLQRYRLLSNKYDWHKYLDDVVDNYNHTYHSTIKATPYDVFYGLDTNKQHFKRVQTNLKLGDYVRYKIHRKVFDKGDALLYSKETYIIDKIDKNKYYLNGIAKPFKEYDLKAITSFIPYTKTDQEIDDEQARVDRKVQTLLAQNGIDARNVVRTKREKKATRTDDYEYY